MASALTSSGPAWSARRPGRAGLVALAGLLIFAVGVIVGLSAGGGDEPPDNSGAAPFSGERVDPGSTATLNRVGVGYARTEAGARAAAEEFTTIGGSSLVTDEEAYLRALATMSAPEWRARAEVTGTNAARFVADRYGEGATVVTTPVLTRVVAADTDAARVEIWAVTTAAGPELPEGEQSWFTARLELRWVGGDWRLAREHSSAGPRRRC